MEKDDIVKIKHLLSTPKNIIIVPHKNPDGDAIGSCLALYHYLSALNQKATIVSPNDYPDFLKWMPGEQTIIKYDSQTQTCDTLINEAEIIFTLDFNAFHRTGNMETVFENHEANKKKNPQGSSKKKTFARNADLHVLMMGGKY